MRLLFIAPLFLFGILSAKAAQNLPYPNITPNRAPQKNNISTPPEEGTPRAQPHQEGIYVSVDFLLWQMRMDGLEYSFTGFEDTSFLSPVGGVQTVPNRWRPGFKVGLGTFLPKDSWRLAILYTWYQNHEAGNITNDTLYPLWDIGNNFSDYNITKGLITTSGAEVRFEYNTIDFSLRKDVFLSDYLRAEPFIGFKAAWMKQNYTVNYAHQFSTLFAEELSMQNNQDFYGIGLRFGSFMQWSFDNMLSIVGNTAYSILWGHYGVTRQDTAQLIPVFLSEPVTEIYTKSSYFTNVSCFEIEIGPKFEWWLYKDVYHFEILGMWEMQYWMNQVQLEQLSPNQILGDLSLTGFTMRFRLDF